MMVSFKEYALNRLANKSVRQSARENRTEVIGGFIPGEEKVSSLFGDSLHQSNLFSFGENHYHEAAPSDAITNISKTPVVFGPETIKYLMHFPRQKWGEALVWLYGEGLKNAADEFNKTGKVEDVKDVKVTGLGRSGNEWTFENVNTGLSTILKELTAPRTDDPKTSGIYSFDLLNGDWVQSNYNTEQRGETSQWRTRNYMSPGLTNISNVLSRYLQGISAGFLGKPENTRFAVPTDFKKTGKPSQKNNVFLNFNGQIMNYKSGEAIPLASPEHLSQYIDPHMLRNSESDRSQVIYKYKAAGATKEIANGDIPLLLPGGLFARHAITAYDDNLKELSKEYERHIAGTPLAQKPVLDVSELHGAVKPEAIQTLQHITSKMLDYLPDSGSKFAAQKVTPREFAAQKANTSVGVELRSFGTLNPASDTKQQEIVSPEYLRKIGLDRASYDGILKKYLFGDNNFKVTGPDETELDSPIYNTIKLSVQDKIHWPISHQEALEGETESMVHQLYDFLPNLDGLGVFKNFVEAILDKQKKGTPPTKEEQKNITNLWKEAAKTVQKRTKSYVNQISQLDLGSGTRRQREKIKTLSGDAISGDSGSILDNVSKQKGVVDRTGLMDIVAKGYKRGNYQPTSYDTVAGKAKFNTSLIAVHDDLKLRQQMKDAKEKGEEIPLKATGTDDASAEGEKDTMPYARQNALDAKIKTRTLNIATLKELKRQQDAGQELDFRTARNIGIKNANKILSGEGLSVKVNDRDLTDNEKSDFLHDLKNPEILKALDQDSITPDELSRDKSAETPTLTKVAKSPEPATSKDTPEDLFPPHLDQSPEVYLVNYFGSDKFRDGLESRPDQLQFAKKVAAHFATKAPQAGKVLLASIARAEQGTKKPSFSDEELEDLHKPQSRHADEPVATPAPVIRPAVTLQPSTPQTPAFKRRTNRSDRFGDF